MATVTRRNFFSLAAATVVTACTNQHAQSAQGPAASATTESLQKMPYEPGMQTVAKPVETAPGVIDMTVSGKYATTVDDGLYQGKPVKIITNWMTTPNHRTAMRAAKAEQVKSFGVTITTEPGSLNAPLHPPTARYNKAAPAPAAN